MILFTVEFQELPGDFGYSEFRLFLPKFREPARKFAWMSGLFGHSILCNRFFYSIQPSGNQRGSLLGCQVCLVIQYFVTGLSIVYNHQGTSAEVCLDVRFVW